MRIQRSLFLALAVSLIAGLFLSGVASAQGQYISGTSGVDISWPNCSANISTVAFGIVGVGGGKVYSDNACAATEAAHFSNLSLYANTGLNADPVNSVYYQQAMVGCNGDAYCAAYNYGFNAGSHAVQYAVSQGLSAPTWWLDVETGNSWNTDTLQNQRSLQGEFDAITQNTAAGTQIGAYSTTYQWGQITNGWLNNWPVWYATAVHTLKQATPYCSNSFSGGSTYLVQYRGRIDQDYAC